MLHRPAPSGRNFGSRGWKPTVKMSQNIQAPSGVIYYFADEAGLRDMNDF